LFDAARDIVMVLATLRDFFIFSCLICVESCWTDQS